MAMQSNLFKKSEAQAPRTLEEKEPRFELHAYFDLAWEIFVRLERDGELDGMDLTNPVVNPTVNAPKGTPQDQPFEPT